MAAAAHATVVATSAVDAADLLVGAAETAPEEPAAEGGTITDPWAGVVASFQQRLAVVLRHGPPLTEEAADCPPPTMTTEDYLREAASEVQGWKDSEKPLEKLAKRVTSGLWLQAWVQRITLVHRRDLQRQQARESDEAARATEPFLMTQEGAVLPWRELVAKMASRAAGPLLRTFLLDHLQGDEARRTLRRQLRDALKVSLPDTPAPESSESEDEGEDDPTPPDSPPGLPHARRDDPEGDGKGGATSQTPAQQQTSGTASQAPAAQGGGTQEPPARGSKDEGKSRKERAASEAASHSPIPPIPSTTPGLHGGPAHSS